MFILYILWIGFSLNSLYNHSGDYGSAEYIHALIILVLLQRVLFGGKNHKGKSALST